MLTLLVLHLLLILLTLFAYVNLVDLRRDKERSILRYFFTKENPIKKTLALFIIVFVPIISFIILGDIILKTYNIKSGYVGRNLSTLSTSEKTWNNMYSCKNCGISSRHYQCVSGSNLKFFNHCQFCSQSNQLEKISGENLELLSDLMFAEEIPSNRIKGHMKVVSKKWLELETRQKEFEKNKFATEMKIKQIKAYEQLKTEDFSEKTSLYEKKLEENLREMEEFREKLLKEM